MFIFLVFSFALCFDDFNNQMLKAHNDYRKLHHVGNLVLDQTLIDIAQAYAEKLANEVKSLVHSHNGYGENLYKCWASYVMSKPSGASVTKDWYDEIAYYNFTSGTTTNPQEAVGHFTQVVWKSTLKMGSGVATADGGKSWYVVSNYDPPGNYLGRFTQNVLPISDDNGSDNNGNDNNGNNGNNDNNDNNSNNDNNDNNGGDNNNNVNDNTSSQSKKGKIIAIVVGVVVGVGICIGVGVVGYKLKNKSTTSEPSTEAQSTPAQPQPQYTPYEERAPGYIPLARRPMY